MADQEQVILLRHSVAEWNEWRKQNPDEPVDLREANLAGAVLSGADLRGANLTGADLCKANLSDAKFAGAILRSARIANAIMHRATLSDADMIQSVLTGADLSGANLSAARLSFAYLGDAKLCNADLNGASLYSTTLIRTDVQGAVLSNAIVFCVNAWDLKGIPKAQENLIITDYREPTVSVDDLEVAQFIYLLLNREKLRNVVNAMTQKGVLILGRFGDGGLEVLQAVAARIRKMGYLPMLFDFERTESRDFTETVKTMVGLARFVIADLSGPSVLKELEATVPDFEVL